MLDHGRKWPEPPDWSATKLENEAVSLRSIPGLPQFFVSGDLSAFLTTHSLPRPLGLLGIASGDRYALSMSRDRMIVVGIGDDEITAGWNSAGYAVTRMSSALHVFELSGSRAAELIARACVLDWRNPGPCAAIQFAGVTTILYRLEDGAFRLHADRGLAPYLWSWINDQGLVREASS